MAILIEAVTAYRPRIKLGKRAKLTELVKLIVARSTLNEGEVYNALRELRDVVAYLCLVGRSVHLDGLTTFTPSIDMDGSFSIGHRLDNQLRSEMNKPNAFTGDIVNRDMVGKTSADLAARWNGEHPDDLIVP